MVRRTILVVGTGSIAAAVARLATDRGHRVHLLPGEPRPAAPPVGEPLAGGDGRVTVVAAEDLGDAAAVTRAVLRLSAAGPVTAVVLAPAPVVRTGPFTSLTAEDLRAALDVGLLGPLAAVRAAVPDLLAAGGVVVTVGSGTPSSGAAATAMTTAALASATRSLAAEYGPLGVHVQGFLTGAAGDPDGTGGSGVGGADAGGTDAGGIDVTAGRTAGRAAGPDELARAVLAVVEHPCPAHAGHTVVLDGGPSPFGVNDRSQ